MVFFLRDRSRTLIRIGASANLAHALKGMERDLGYAPEVLGVAGGGDHEARVLRRHFDPMRAADEPGWFDAAPALLGFIAERAQPWNGTALEVKGNVLKRAAPLRKRSRQVSTA